MKKFYLLTVFVLAIIIFLWLMRLQPSLLKETSVTQKQEAQKAEASSSTANPAMTDIPAKPDHVDQRTWDNLLITYKTSVKQNVPIRFYGKVVDQFDQGVSGVKVRARVSAFNAAGFFNMNRKLEDVGKYTWFDLVTDTEGRFSVESKGENLMLVEYGKEGYTPQEKFEHTFRYSPRYHEQHSPDEHKPVIYRLWKKGQTEPLVRGEKFFGIIPDGRSYVIDFLKQTKTEGEVADGDIILKIMRPSQVKPNEKYDWNYSISVPGGGLVKTQDSIPFYAPENTYQTHYQEIISVDNPKWSRRVDRKFYIKSRNGEVYTTIYAEINSNYNNNAIFSVKFISNPNGSRNLEYDPQKDVTKQYKQ